jgi:hypothetical protein
VKRKHSVAEKRPEELGANWVVDLVDPPQPLAEPAEPGPEPESNPQPTEEWLSGVNRHLANALKIATAECARLATGRAAAETRVRELEGVLKQMDSCVSSGLQTATPGRPRRPTHGAHTPSATPAACLWLHAPHRLDLPATPILDFDGSSASEAEVPATGSILVTVTEVLGTDRSCGNRWGARREPWAIFPATISLENIPGQGSGHSQVPPPQPKLRSFGSPCDGKEMDLADACSKEFGRIGPHLRLSAGETTRTGDDL